MSTNRKVRWIALGVGIVVVVFGVVLALNVSGSDPNVTEGRFTGQDVVAPGFASRRTTTLRRSSRSRHSTGEQLALSDLAGKTVVVNFWNTWCIPCIQEAPALKEFYERHKDDPDFAMIGIVRDDDKQNGRATTSRPRMSGGRSRSTRRARLRSGSGPRASPRPS